MKYWFPCPAEHQHFIPLIWLENPCERCPALKGWQKWNPSPPQKSACKDGVGKEGEICSILVPSALLHPQINYMFLFIHAYLQCTEMGPSWPNCSLVLCTCPMKSIKPSPDFGTPCSGQSVNWNWRTVLDWPSWGKKQQQVKHAVFVLRNTKGNLPPMRLTCFAGSSLGDTKSQTNLVLKLIYNDEAAHLALDIFGVRLSVQIYTPGRCPESSNHCKDCTDGVFSKGTFKVRWWPLYQSSGRVAIVSELQLTGR